MTRRKIPIEFGDLLPMKDSGELIGKYVRNPNSHRLGRKIQGRVIKVNEVYNDGGGGCNFIEIRSTHSGSIIVEGFRGEDRFGKYIGSTWGSRIYLEKEWRKSCRTCAYPCKKHKRCPFHSDNSVVIKR